jgi:hypothetical protein
MAQTKSFSDVDPASAYQHSFGNLPNGTLISPGGRATWGAESKNMEGDLRPTLKSAFVKGFAELKALASTSGGAGTAGYAMIPIYVDPQVVDRTRKYTPLVELIPRVSNMGVTADYNVITAKGGATTAVEDAALSETTTTYARASTAIKYLYSVGRVTGQAIAAMPSYIMAGFQPSGGATGAFGDVGAPNAMQNEVLVKTREMREKQEDLIINGDATVTASQYSGIIKLLGATNTVDKNTTALALDDLDLAVRYAFDDGGRPNLAVCSSGVYTDLLGLLTSKIGYMQPTSQVFWGFTTIVLHTMVGDIPVIPSMYMSNTSGSKAIYFLDLSVVEMRVLQDLTYEDLAHTNDSRKFLLKVYEALIIKAVDFCSSVTEISG